MTMLAPALAAPALPHSLVRFEPRFAAMALLLGLLAVPTLAASLLDDRSFLGTAIWIKPLKFEIALALYLGTLALYARWLPRGMTGRRWYRIYSAVVVAAVAAEILWIGGAAAFGTGSHFNVATPRMAMLYSAMGVAAVTLTSAALVYGIAIWRNAEAGLAPALRLGLGLGLVLTFALTLIAAGALSLSAGHLVGGSGGDAGGLAPMGWARGGGDLRVAHFFATHAMHAVPLAALGATRLLPARAASLATLGFVAAYAGLTAFTFAQALDGRPFLPMLG